MRLTMLNVPGVGVMPKRCMVGLEAGDGRLMSEVPVYEFEPMPRVLVMFVGGSMRFFEYRDAPRVLRADEVVLKCVYREVSGYLSDAISDGEYQG